MNLISGNMPPDPTRWGSNLLPPQTKWSFVTRRVNRLHISGIAENLTNAVAGDLALGQVTAINRHKKIQLAEGRLSELYPGDHVVLACADAHLPEQFKGSAELNGEASDLLTPGGLAGKMLAHGRPLPATRIKPLGLLRNSRDETINLQDYAFAKRDRAVTVPVIGVAGTALNSGKTTAAASLGFGLRRLGYRVAALKITGAGAFDDVNAYYDAGCAWVADFTDAGLASTHNQPVAKIITATKTLLSQAEGRCVDVIIMEIGDGLFQHQTETLLKSAYIHNLFNGVILAATDVLNALIGARVLRRYGLPPVVIAGKVAASPAATAEIQTKTGIKVASGESLRETARVQTLIKTGEIDFAQDTKNRQKAKIVAA